LAARRTMAGRDAARGRVQAAIPYKCRSVRDLHVACHATWKYTNRNLHR